MSPRIDLIRQVVRQWDPYGLLALGAPADEFDREIQSIARQADRMNSPRDAACLLARVFSASFSDPQRFTPESCATAGEALYRALRGP